MLSLDRPERRRLGNTPSSEWTPKAGTILTQAPRHNTTSSTSTPRRRSQLPVDALGNVSYFGYNSFRIGHVRSLPLSDANSFAAFPPTTLRPLTANVHHVDPQGRHLYDLARPRGPPSILDALNTHTAYTTRPPDSRPGDSTISAGKLLSATYYG